MLSLGVTGLASVLILSLAIYNYFLHPALISPLAQIPNAHWSAPFSPVWILWSRYTSCENRKVHAAHEKHGSIVRLGPGEVSVNCVNGGIRTIYGTAFEKSDWYSIFDNFGVPCMFSTLTTRPHSARKRMISNVYSKSSIHSSKAGSAQASKILYSRLLPMLETPEFAQGADVWEIWMSCAMDFITSYEFGLANATNFLEHVKLRRWFLGNYQIRHDYTFWSQEFFRFTKLVHSLPLVRLFPHWVDLANRELESFVAGLCRNTTDALNMQQISSRPEDEPVILSAILEGYQKDRATKGSDSIIANTTSINPEMGVASEVLDHVAAGMETSGITLTYVSWRLSKDQNLQAILRAELNTLERPIVFPVGKDADMEIPDPKQLDSLPLLHAILMETLRVNSAIPGSQPRLSPHPSSELCGYVIPGGVRVSASAYGLHRVESAFPNALHWDPTRWLDDGKEKTEQQKERDRHFWAFGSGGKMCIGSNFAIHELKLLMAAVWTNYQTHVVDDEGIEQTDGYIGGPKSNKLVLRFEKVRSE